MPIQFQGKNAWGFTSTLHIKICDMFLRLILSFSLAVLGHIIYFTRFVEWETGKVVLKIACTTDVTVCRVHEGGDLELPIDGVGTPTARVGT